MNLDADSAGLLWFWLGTAFLWTSGWLPDMKKISRLGPSPFKPGYGAMPPVLAGRDCERARLGDFVDCLVRKEAPASAAAIWGPRGNGKTVLLADIRRKAVSADLDVVDVQPDQHPEPDRLNELFVRIGWKEAKKQRGRRTGIRSGFEAGLESKTTGVRLEPASSLAELFVRRAQDKPLVVLVDEAHTLDPAVGRALFNAEQNARSRESPVLLVLAGTPDMEDRCDEMNASFWSRLGEGDMPLNLLESAAAGEAVFGPLREAGVDVPSAEHGSAVARVIESCNGYPYFTQAWGAALWRVLRESGEARVDDVVVTTAEPAFDRIRRDYYRRRYAELRRHSLQHCAYAVALQLDAVDSTSRKRIFDAVREGLKIATGSAKSAEVLEAERRLRHLGVVWRADPAQWTPGIPSLLGHVIAEFEAEHPEDARDLRSRVSR